MRLLKDYVGGMALAKWFTPGTSILARDTTRWHFDYKNISGPREVGDLVNDGCMRAA